MLVTGTSWPSSLESKTKKNKERSIVRDDSPHHRSSSPEIGQQQVGIHPIQVLSSCPICSRMTRAEPLCWDLISCLGGQYHNSPIQISIFMFKVRGCADESDRLAGSLPGTGSSEVASGTARQGWWEGENLKDPGGALQAAASCCEVTRYR